MIHRSSNLDASPKTLTLVVPNYNGSKYIIECIGSVASQINERCEVILVDDGSTDDSIDLVSHFVSRQQLAQGIVRIVSTANFGLSMARNRGIIESVGKYVAFLDSDDYVLPGFIDTLLNVIDQFEPEIIQFNERRISANGECRGIIKCHTLPEGLYSSATVREDIFRCGKWFAHARVFLNRVIRDTMFPMDREFYEDLATLPKLFMKDIKVFLCSKELVAYRDNPQGVTRNHKPDHAKTLLKLYEYYSTIPKSTGRDLLRIQLARTLIHFKIELGIGYISIANILADIKTIKCDKEISLKPSKTDFLFINYTLLYLALLYVKIKVSNF